jgi:hypothetical protein
MSTQDNVSRAGDQITQRNLGIQPTITIRPGTPVRLVAHKDLVLAPLDRGGEMADIKLAQLPDRTPVKLSFSATPDLQQALAEYAALYNRTYGRDEPVSELIPAMLAAFLESDRAFVRARGAGR